MADAETDAKPVDQDTLVADIDRTRAQLARTIDAISDRVSPKKNVNRALEQARQRAGHRGLLRRGLARVGQRAPQPVLGVEQPDHREQLAAQPDAHGGAGDVLGRQLLGEFGERGPTHTAHAHSPSGRAWKISAERNVVPAAGQGDETQVSPSSSQVNPGIHHAGTGAREAAAGAREAAGAEEASAEEAEAAGLEDLAAAAAEAEALRETGNASGDW